MLEIKIQENLFDVKIKDRIFSIDADNIDNHLLIDKFIKNTEAIVQLTIPLLKTVKSSLMNY